MDCDAGGAVTPTSTSRLWRAARLVIQRVAWLAGTEFRAMTAVAIAAMLVGALSAAVGRVPVPKVHDEFSYLLASDTFSHGRLTNPPHPLWTHFESFHIIQQPTYASKYPVAQGLTLALGQVLTGLPIVGVWIGVALAAAATCWMLYGWVPPFWAMCGGGLLVLHPTVMNWNHNYWGGGVAMFGGALLLGGARRVAVRQPRSKDAVALGVGLAVLANSRPFEGLVLALVVMGFLFVWLITQRQPWPVTVKRIVAPVLIVGALTGTAMGYYNYRVTGSPLRLPYLVHEATYARMPIFFWQTPRAVTLRHQAMRSYWTPEGHHVGEPQRSRLENWIRGRMKSVSELLESYAGNRALLIALVFLPWSVRRDPWTRVALLVLGISVAGILVGANFQVHYAAPMVPLTCAIAIRALREGAAMGTRGRVLILLAALFTLKVAVGQTLRLEALDLDDTTWAAKRARMQTELAHTGEQHLVVVRYTAQHNPMREWVFNAADIDASPVVWAREMDAEADAALFVYYRARHTWLLEADAEPPRLVPYPAAANPAKQQTLPAAGHPSHPLSQ